MLVICWIVLDLIDSHIGLEFSVDMVKFSEVYTYILFFPILYAIFTYAEIVNIII